MDEMDEIIKEFLAESNEALDQFDRDMVGLEKDPTSKELLGRIFRGIHTIKGTGGVLGFPKLVAIAHVGENLLSRMRDGEVVLRPEIATVLLKMADALREILERIGQSSEEGNKDYPEIIQQLTELLNGSPAKPAEAPAAPAPATVVAPPEAPALTGEVKNSRPKPVKAAVKRAAAKGKAKAGKTAKSSKAAKGAKANKLAKVVKTAKPAPKAQKAQRPVSKPEVAAAKPATPPPAVNNVMKSLFAPPAKPAAPKVEEKPPVPVAAPPVPAPVTPAPVVNASPAAPSAEPETIDTSKGSQGIDVSSNTIRVDVGLLDKLMNLVGELVLARNQILQFTTSQKETSFLGASQRLNLITTELQEGVMKTRMQPIGTIWNKLPRLIRDLAVSCGKQVEIDMEGADTELDKTIIEAIKDPLTHIIRNSVDHGIEMPEVRVSRGKPATGRLTLRAFHEGGQVNIEITDDGEGIRTEKLKQKAVANGLITPEHAARMSEREVLNLVFAPGLSTAQKVTNISGRGVGMDVVKTNLEKIGGQIDIQSMPGQGTNLKIKIPLTLAIIPALIATSGSERFAIPQVNLLELVRVEGEQVNHAIEMIHGSPVYRLRGRLLPLVYLNRQLKLERRASGGHDEAHLDFASAKAKHSLWIQRLTSMIRESTAIQESEACAKDECDLGKWLYGGAMQRYSYIPETKALEQVHGEFHTAVCECVRAWNKSDEEEAEQQMNRAKRLSGRVLELLDVMARNEETERVANIVVLQAGDRQFGLVVDEINDTEEIVVKPLAKQIKRIACFAGATIMGDGKVALILDVIGLAQMSKVFSELSERAVSEAITATEEGSSSRESWLLFRVGDHGRMAIPLSLVSRLEEFPAKMVERCAGKEVVQYRDQIIPLVRISRALGLENTSNPETLQVIVHSASGRTVGLVVEEILDITGDHVVVDGEYKSEGYGGAAVIQQHVTDLLDVPALLAQAEVKVAGVTA